MSKIVTFASQKGGAGKSSLALSTFHCLSKFSTNIKTALIDLDPQKSIYNLSQQDDSLKVLDKYQKKDLEKFDVVLIDTPPRISPDFDKVFTESNLIILPSKISYIDAVATVQMYKYLEKIKQNQKSFVVLNCAAHSTNYNNDVLESFKAADIPLLDTVVYNRIAYQKMFSSAGNIFKQKPRNLKAESEVKDLTTEIFTLLSKY